MDGINRVEYPVMENCNSYGLKTSPTSEELLMS